MSGRRIVKGKARRATCPECGRSIACYMDRYGITHGTGLRYLLAPHVSAPGVSCKGWIVYLEHLEKNS